jgi:heme/copper-type cytochrome/quinol oxidase subunit 3
MVMKQRVFIPLLLAVLGFCSPDKAAAQGTTPVPVRVEQVVAVPQDADFVRDRLRDVLQSYPRSVGEILQRDPSLMTRADYMAPYPALSAFLTQHPEIVRNPEYYFEGYGSWGRQQFDPEFEALGILLGGMAGFFVISTSLGLFAWVVKAVIQHRRWLKASTVQAEVHTKLMDRMTTNEELLNYIQSPAGRRFLESAPVRADVEAPNIAAPVGPIIFSMMMGIVLATVGVGFRLAGNYIGDDSQKAFVVVGLIILALGAGFILASLMAYLVSSRLGLFPARAAAESTSSHA